MGVSKVHDLKNSQTLQKRFHDQYKQFGSFECGPCYFVGIAGWFIQTVTVWFYYVATETAKKTYAMMNEIS